MGILTGGILFCGSRSVFVLFVFIVIILALKKHIEKRTVFLIIVLGAVFFLTALFFIDLDIERLFKLTLKSSTLNGRFLYWKDAVRMIIKNPLGLGYIWDSNLALRSDGTIWDITDVPKLVLDLTTDAYVMGDVNEDGVVNIEDLRIVLRGVCGKIELSERQLMIADVVPDDGVDIQDLRKILRFVCGKITEL